MRPRIIYTIFRKEFVEAWRDWLTLTLVVGFPIVLYPPGLLIP